MVTQRKGILVRKKQVYKPVLLGRVYGFAQGTKVCMLELRNSLCKLELGIQACKMVLDTVVYHIRLTVGKERNL